jgi:hypothetical protein
MALALNKIIVSGLNSDADGAYFDYVTRSVTAGTDYTVPAGLYIVYPVANCKFQAYNGSAWADVIAANTGGMIVSDGQNVKIVSTSGTVTAAYLTVNGGAAATGTYNS